jgi:transcriptional regulator with XRE-family HTH domain
MKRFSVKGDYVKQSRESRERHATQKEFAYELGISERNLRSIENGSVGVTGEVLERMAKSLGVHRQALLIDDGPPSPGLAVLPSSGHRPPQEQRLVPRFDTTIAGVCTEASHLIELGSHKSAVFHILTTLTAETEAYAAELFELIESLTWDKRPLNQPLMAPLDGPAAVALRRRLRELIVLLKGNDVWIYGDTHFKTLPESFEVRPKGEPRTIEMQGIVALGPPGEYGETTITIPIDHGQPFYLSPLPLADAS